MTRFVSSAFAALGLLSFRAGLWIFGRKDHFDPLGAAAHLAVFIRQLHPDRPWLLEGGRPRGRGAPAPGAAAAIQLVVGGRATAAIANPSSQMIAVQKGSTVKFFYSAQRGDIFGIGLPQGGGLNSLDDLKGKTIGVTSFASGGTIYAKGLLNEAGLAERDYTLVEIGVGARAASALKSGQVQALSMYDEAYAQLEQAGLPMSKIIRDPRAKNYISGSIVVQNEDLPKQKHADWTWRGESPRVKSSRRPTPKRQ